MTISESYFLISLLTGIGYLQSSLTELVFFNKFSRAATYPLSTETVGSKKLSLLIAGSNNPLLHFVIALKSFSGGLFLFFIFYDTIPFYLPLLMILMDQLGFFRFRLVGRSETPLQRVVLITLTMHLYANEPAISKIGLVFISLMLSLAYFATGYQKRNDPKWRNGTGILNFTQRYLNGTYLYSFLMRIHSPLRLLSYLVVFYELCFFLSLLHPNTAITFFCFGALFHLGISVTSGINEFLWAFTGCYPAVFYVSHLVHDQLTNFI